MGANVSQEQQEAVRNHLEAQDRLIQQLKSVVEQQSRALAALADDEGDFDGEEQELQGQDAGAEEFDHVDRCAAAAESKEPEPEVDDAERQQKDEVYREPTEDEERNFAATKPWLGAMAPPTNYAKKLEWDEKPDKQLQLEYVHGYRSRLCRNNVYWVDNNRIVYFAAALGVVKTINNNTQSFFDLHQDDILSIDYHAGRNVVVTGEQGKMPTICVWDVNTKKMLSKMAGYHKRAVVSVAFSADGTKVVSVGLDDNHSVAVYDWSSGQLVYESKGDTAKIISVVWNTTKEANANTDFVTVGKRHIKFWTPNGSRLEAKKGIISQRGGKNQAFVTACTTDEYTIVGCQNGDLYKFSKNILKSIVAAHTGMVYCLRTSGATICSGGKDGALNVWDLNLNERLKQIKFNDSETVERNSVRSVDYLDSSTVCVGTVTSNIYKVNINTAKITDHLVTGHYGNMKSREYGELWGLTINPINPNFYATVCEDATLRIWDIQARVQAGRVALSGPALSCNWSPDGKLIAVGYSNGMFGLVDVEASVELISRRMRKRRIPCVKFSPCGQFLAVGTAESVVDIYRGDGENWDRIGKCTGASSVILHVDWSKDSKWIQINSQAYELLFYTQKGEFHSRSRQLKDEQWASQECILGWNVQGIWPKYSDGSDVNMVNKSHNEKYLATAEDSGLIKIFNYPCIGSGLDRRGKLNKRPNSHRHHGHSSHVTNVNWSADDQYVLSCGGADLMVGQWKVVPAQ